MGQQCVDWEQNLEDRIRSMGSRPCVGKPRPASSQGSNKDLNEEGVRVRTWKIPSEMCIEFKSVRSHRFNFQRLKRTVLKFYTTEVDQAIAQCPWELQSFGISEAEVLCGIWEGCHWFLWVTPASGSPHGFTDLVIKDNRVLFWKSTKTPECFQFSNVLSLVQTTRSDPLSFFILLCVTGFPIWFTHFPLYSIELVYIALPCTTSAFANHSN